MHFSLSNNSFAKEIQEVVVINDNDFLKVYQYAAMNLYNQTTKPIIALHRSQV